MPEDQFFSITDQVAQTLRKGIMQGRWREVLPGRDRLANDLGVSHKTMELAMRRLSKEGLIASQGPGQRRRIVVPMDKSEEAKSMSVRILHYEPDDKGQVIYKEVFDQLHREGFDVSFADKSLMELNMNAKRVARMVEKTEADAWIVVAGSHEVLEWFCNQPLPAYALYGVKSALPIAGTGIRRDFKAIVERLSSQGHQRIIFIVREEHVKPKPALNPREFLQAMESKGIKTGAYNLPAWGQTPEGLHHCLDSLFQHTPPTALIVSEAPIFIAVRDYLSRMGIQAPGDISLICLDPDISFSWCDPQVSHFTYDHRAVARRVRLWVQSVVRGKEDNRQTVTMAKFVEGGTVGTARN